MKVILCKDVKGSGKKGDVIDVKDGFGGFLIKSGSAKVADAKALNENKQQKQAQEFHRLQVLQSNRELKEKIDGIVIEIQGKGGETGKFFGSITGKEISEKLIAMGFDIDKKKILLESNIKSVGEYCVPIRISAEETAKITVKVTQ